MKKILIIVDYQNDFVDPRGALTVPNANTIADNIQTKIDSDEYTSTIFTFDTHTKKVYETSDESKIFPIHCEFNTKGWNFFKIKPQSIKWTKFIKGRKEPFEMYQSDNEYFFTKDVFNIWDGNTTYPKWFEKTFPIDEYEIDIVGVATNYCVFMNVMGMVERGYKVNVIQDSVEGIKAFPDGSIDESYEKNINVMKNRGVNFI